MTDSRATLLLMKQLKGMLLAMRARLAGACARTPRQACAPPLSDSAPCASARTHLYPAELNKSPVEGFSAGLVDESNPYDWEICIMGPPETP